jgi:hypothetical protein
MCLLPMTDVCTNLEGVDEEGISWSMYDGDGWVDVGVGRGVTCRSGPAGVC